MPAILAIESALLGGSLCLFAEGGLLAQQVGTRSASRAEELLQNIDFLLKSTDTNVSDLDRVAVSTGPGSYTGIRVGIVTALGLTFSSGVPCVGVSVFAALAAHPGGAGTILAAVETRTDEFAWEVFQKSEEEKAVALGTSETGTLGQLIMSIDERGVERITVGDALAAKLKDAATCQKPLPISAVGGTPAEWIAAAVNLGFGGEPRPMYLSASQGGRVLE